jgi:phosphoglycerate dehydrogenase-like enzyme
VAVLDDYQQVAADLAEWTSLGMDVTFFDHHLGSADEVAAALVDFEVVVAMRERTPFPADLLARLPALRLLVTTGSRNAAIDLAAAAQHNITVCATGYSSNATVEHTWAMIFAVARHLPTEFASMAAGGWQRTLGVGLSGRTLGLAGLGNVGSAVGRIGVAFGMDVIAWSQHLTPDRAQAVGATAVTKDELLARADVLSIHQVLSDRTRGLIGAAELAQMKPSVLLVNSSRGPIVDESALVDALQRNVIAGAALDVFDVEPLPAAHPLRSLPTAVLTPHLGYVVDELYGTFYRDAVEDIAQFAAGSPVRVLS